MEETADIAKAQQIKIESAENASQNIKTALPCVIGYAKKIGAASEDELREALKFIFNL